MKFFQKPRVSTISIMDKNKRILLILSLIFLSMLSLSFASVPLYDIFCRYTGFGGTPQTVNTYSENKSIIEDEINIRFDSNISPKLNWEFFPEKLIKTIKIGEETKALYYAQNIDNKPLIGTSIFNVAPAKAGQYFMKIECFCFNKQKLMPGEKVSMPVVFYIDPEIKNDLNTQEINEITLSYTFMPYFDKNS